MTRSCLVPMTDHLISCDDAGMRLLGLTLAALLLTACGGGGEPAATETEASPEPLTVSGQLALDATGNDVVAMNGRKGAECWGEDGMADLKGGAQVVIRDSSGKTIGTGSIDAGAMSTRLYDPAALCVFTFTVPDVKTDDDFLSAEVAHRGQIQFKRQEAAAVSLTLG